MTDVGHLEHDADEGDMKLTDFAEYVKEQIRQSSKKRALEVRFFMLHYSKISNKEGTIVSRRHAYHIHDAALHGTHMIES